MESKAISRYNKQSARKMRKVVDCIRGNKVDDAINFLHFSTEKASLVIEKTVRSAVANLMQSDEENSIEPDSLYIKEAFVNQGPVMKRFRAASMGRASRLRRPTSHLTVIVESR